MLFELGERCHPIFQLPFPIVPELRGDPAVAGPIARRVREELFSIHFTRGKSDHFLFCEAKCSCPYNRVNAGTQRCAPGWFLWGAQAASLHFSAACRKDSDGRASTCDRLVAGRLPATAGWHPALPKHASAARRVPFEQLL